MEIGRRGINRDDSGRVFFYCVDNVLAIDGVSGEIKTRFFKVAFKNDAGSFFAETAVPVLQDCLSHDHNRYEKDECR